MDGKVVGMEGRVGSEVVGSGGSVTPVTGMLPGKLGSGGNLGREVGNVGCGRFGIEGMFGTVGKGGRGGSAVGLGNEGNPGMFGGAVCRRWRAARLVSMVENTKVAVKVRIIKYLEEAIVLSMMRRWD